MAFGDARDAILPYQVRKSSLIIVAATAQDALVIFDSMGTSEQVTIQDMDGHKVDPETLRAGRNALSRDLREVHPGRRGPVACMGRQHVAPYCRKTAIAVSAIDNEPSANTTKRN